MCQAIVEMNGRTQPTFFKGPNNVRSDTLLVAAIKDVMGFLSEGKNWNR